MNDEIDDMVTDDVRSAEEIIQGKTSVGNRAGNPSFRRFAGDAVEGPRKVIWAETFQMDTSVLDDVDEVIEMPLAFEAVRIDEQQGCKKSDKSKRRPAIKGDRKSPG